MSERPVEGRPGRAGAAEAPPCRAAGTLILAVGDTLRADDGAGAAVLEELRESRRLPAAVRLLDAGTAGLDIALTLGEVARAIIVDAADLGMPAGNWTRLGGDGLGLVGHHEGSSTHSAGLADALALGEALGLLPEELVLYAIQPETLSFQEGLSAPVARAVPQVTSAILEELGRDSTGSSEEEKAWQRSS
ncbi:MAG: hydrogenase maturation protease [Anaerolineales bacterium]